ncbi:MAG: hypothetical protein C0200_05210 [Thermoproteota archaeon]|nr:MAG: hypothetical protein C0200_05210 [Candidatus Korarchaeota archaeon]
MIAAIETTIFIFHLPLSAVEKIGRFQVMALLQAARYYLLKGDVEKAKSFGLNRAIFYAWAKRSGKPLPHRRRTAGASAPSIPSHAREIEALGNENAYVNEEGFFVIGSEVQRPEDYDREVVKRIEDFIPYDEAWNAAISYLKSFPRDVLLDQRKFYEKVYLPIRDRFIEIVRRSKGGLELAN